jgi:hypothetical protein
MNVTPLEALGPVFHFLDCLIEACGVYLYLVLVWLSLFVIAWVFGGGLRRKFPNQPLIRAGIGIVIQPPAQPPTLIIFGCDSSENNDG